MCGIFGVWSATADRTTLQSMAAILRHRGPDDTGLYHDSVSDLWLGMNRLAIIDLSPAGHQPMESEDGNVVLVFNGEIYNFLELRQELEGHGHRFYSRCDTEVILRGWMQWGEGVVDRLRGMFAFALWDRRSRELFLARDTTGIKPLFYCTLPGGGFAFSSELKAFAALPQFEFAVDHSALSQYVEFGYVWDGEHAIVSNARKVPPGSSLRVRERTPQAVRCWWQLPAVGDAKAFSDRALDQAADELFEILNEVVRQHLIADVPVGLLLSGGLDSSVLAAIAARHCPGLRTFSIGFDPCPQDERKYARLVAEHLGTEHHEIILGPPEVLRNFRDLAWFYDDLFWDTGFISSLTVYRRCREEGLKVALVGEGADEVFGGYGAFDYLSGKNAEYLPSKLHRYLFFRQYSGQNVGKCRAAFSELIRRLNEKAQGDWFSTVRRYELGHQIPNNLNMKVDRASMAYSVEARVPYQDRRVIEFVTTLPRQFFRSPTRNKLLLRHMAVRHRLLPAEITDRKKLGLMMPDEWIGSESEFSRAAAELVLRPDSWAQKLGYAGAVRNYFDGGERKSLRFFRKHVGLGTLAWRLFVLESWRDAYSEGEIRNRVAAAAGIGAAGSRA
jgi:asparagine synthase (glutamine-hydrolysing)